MFRIVVMWQDGFFFTFQNLFYFADIPSHPFPPRIKVYTPFTLSEKDEEI